MKIVTLFDYLYYCFYDFSEKYYADPYANSIGLWALYVCGSILFFSIIITDILGCSLPLWWIVVWLIMSLIICVLVQCKYRKKIKYLKKRWRYESLCKRRIRGLLIVLYLLIELSSTFICYKIIYGTWTKM